MTAHLSAHFPVNLPSNFPDNLPAHVQASIESICELGCGRVNEIIDALAFGDSVEEINGLDKTDQQWVLIELKAIMAVYDNNQA